jgi:hypothetical protein
MQGLRGTPRIHIEYGHFNTNPPQALLRLSNGTPADPLHRLLAVDGPIGILLAQGRHSNSFFAAYSTYHEVAARAQALIYKYTSARTPAHDLERIVRANAENAFRDSQRTRRKDKGFASEQLFESAALRSYFNDPKSTHAVVYRLSKAAELASSPDAKALIMELAAETIVQAALLHNGQSRMAERAAEYSDQAIAHGCESLNDEPDPIADPMRICQWYSRWIKHPGNPSSMYRLLGRSIRINQNSYEELANDHLRMAWATLLSAEWKGKIDGECWEDVSQSISFAARIWKDIPAHQNHVARLVEFAETAKTL